MLEKIQNIFRKVFQDDNLIVSENTSAKDIPMWDSLSHLELIADIETFFNIKFSFQEVMGFNCVGDIMRVISQKKDKN